MFNFPLRKIKLLWMLFLLIGVFLVNPSNVQSGEHPQDPSVTKYAIPGILYKYRLEFYEQYKIPWEKATPEQQDTFLKYIQKTETQEEKQLKLDEKNEKKKTLKEERKKELEKKQRIQNDKKIEKKEKTELKKRYQRLKKDKKEMMKKVHTKRAKIRH